MPFTLNLNLDKKLFKNFINLLVIHGATLIAPILVLPYLSRTFEPTEFGLYSFYMTFLIIINVILDFGYNIYGVIAISKSNNNNELNKLFSSSIVIKFILSCIVFVLLNFFVAKDFNLSPSIVNLVWLNGVIITFQSIWVFQAKENMSGVRNASIVTKLLYLILVFAFIDSGDDFELLFSILLLSNIALMVYCWLALYKFNVHWERPKFFYLANTVKDVVPFFLSRVFVSIYSSGNIIVLGRLGAMNNIHLYSPSEKIYQIFQSLLSPVNSALIPYMSSRGKLSWLMKISIFILPFILVISVSIFFFSEELINIVFGNEYANGQNVLKIFSFVLIVTLYNSLWGFPAFSSVGKEKLVNISTYFSCGFYIILVGVLYCFDLISVVSLSWVVFSVELISLLMRLFFLFFLVRKECA